MYTCSFIQYSIGDPVSGGQYIDIVIIFRYCYIISNFDIALADFGIFEKTIFHNIF